MAAGSTYTPIATYTVPSAAANYTFSSISGSYTDLVLIINGGASTNADAQIQFNGDTGSNYSVTVLRGDGTTVNSTRSSAATYWRVDSYGYLSTANSTIDIVQIMNYSNTTTYKTGLSRANNAGAGVDATVGLWRNTAAITSIKLFTDTGTFNTGTTFTLYGIAAA